MSFDDPLFLDVEDVLELHASQLALYTVGARDFAIGASSSQR